MQHIVAPVDFLVQTSPIAAVAVACFLALFGIGVSVICGSLAARTLPGRVQNRVDELDAAVSTIEQTAMDLRAQWANTLEQLETFESSIEKKRRQLAASASRAERAQREIQEDQAPQPMDPEAQLIAIRQRIYGAG